MNPTDLPLFDQPLCRRLDPVSSFEAAENLTTGEKWRGQKRAVLETLQRHPGVTSAELAEIMGWDRHCVAKRLPEIVRAGGCHRGAFRFCAATKTKCLTWWPGPAPEKEVR